MSSSIACPGTSRSSFPPSHCPAATRAIKKRHNVPVLGWLLLRGRCAGCAGRISPRYPLVEADHRADLRGADHAVRRERRPACLPVPRRRSASRSRSSTRTGTGCRRPSCCPPMSSEQRCSRWRRWPRATTHTLLRACVGAAALAMTQLLFVMDLPFGGAGALQLAGLFGLVPRLARLAGAAGRSRRRHRHLRCGRNRPLGREITPNPRSRSRSRRRWLWRQASHCSSRPRSSTGTAH